MEKSFSASPGGAIRRNSIDEGLRAHLGQVYSVMATGLVVTGASAWWIGSDAVRLAALKDSPLMWLAILSPLIIVLTLTLAGEKLSAGVMRVLFYLLALMTGISMSTIFQVFAGADIASAFLATAAGFAGLSIYGYTTSRDLSGLGIFLLMALIGLIVAMIANIFLASGTMNLVISLAGVLIFALLIAFDTQSIKAEYLARRDSADNAWLSKAATMGALSLYLDFINLFRFLLELFHTSKDD
ncbi:Bax inhibitor-1/YccA family protein [Paracoccus litorisediminis]|uniref:Bax inhibitor-1/YccA family protein n=1 Tax=Paracoccus litorisediminis TaxID=2006130 RepID=UPI0037307013